MSDDQLETACEVMHDAYERAAVGAGWETNPASRKPWADVPEPNKATMRAAVAALLGHLDAGVARWGATSEAADGLARIKALVHARVPTLTFGEAEWLVDEVERLRAEVNALRPRRIPLPRGPGCLRHAKDPHPGNCDDCAAAS